jgi:hypothetical protein
MNEIGSMGRGGCSCSRLISVRAQVGASVSKMSLLSTSETPPISL